MNKLIASFFVGCGVIASAGAESLLKPTSFPNTFDDVPFSDRMKLKAEDYELYRPEYDDDGFCIKNCAYPGLNIKYELEKSEEDTAKSVQQSQQYEQKNQEKSDTQTAQSGQSEQPAQNLPVNTQNIISSISSSSTAASCANRNSDIPSGQKVPRGEPLKGKPKITSSYGPRRLEGKNSFHDGIDYGVPVGTPVYTTAEGKVARVINDSRCGKGLRIRHGDGTQTIYCHLSKQLVSNGSTVGAGCKIAESGNTGHSTGPHLHYGMRDSSGNKINPASYTKRAK